MRRRPIAYALLLCYLPACTSWHVEETVSPQQLIAAEHPNAVRVTLPDRSRIVLHQPRIAAGDSLAGVVHGAPFSVAVSDVGWVATRRVSIGRTLELILGTTMAVALIAGGAAAASMK